MFFSCVGGSKMITFVDINDAYVFKSFYKAGTTAVLRNFYNEEKNNFGNKNKITKIELSRLKDVLKDLEWKIHTQKKITGIEKGFELCDFNNCYCFILTKEMIIDINRSSECYLTLEQHSFILKTIGL